MLFIGSCANSDASLAFLSSKSTVGLHQGENRKEDQLLFPPSIQLNTFLLSTLSTAEKPQGLKEDAQIVYWKLSLQDVPVKLNSWIAMGSFPSKVRLKYIIQCITPQLHSTVPIEHAGQHMQSLGGKKPHWLLLGTWFPNKIFQNSFCKDNCPLAVLV